MTVAAIVNNVKMLIILHLDLLDRDSADGKERVQSRLLRNWVFEVNSSPQHRLELIVPDSSPFSNLKETL